jgi:predicted AAA+ superfamily ATPase
MYQRQIAQELKQMAGDYPIVTVTGPRQSGKTTLVQHVFPTKPYVNLENPDTRSLANSDPRSFLEQ